MLWECSTCKRSGNRGLVRECAGCGKQKEETDREYFPDDVSEAAAIAPTEGGPDRKCPYCKTLQDDDWEKCSNCGAPKADGGPSWKAREVSLTEDVGGSRTLSEREVLIEGSSGFDDPAAENYQGARSVPPSASSKDVETPTIRKRRTLTYAVPVFLVMAAVLLVWWILSPRYVDARVESMHWDHVVHVERYKTVGEEGWSSPGDAFEERDVGKRVHHYDRVFDHYKLVPDTERVACGKTPRVCRSIPKRCKSKGDGTATCSGGGETCSGGDTKYCNKSIVRKEAVYRQEPRYAMWRSWKVWRWKHERDVRKDGHTRNPAWPSEKELLPPNPLTGGEKERTSRTAKYGVGFRDKDGEEHKVSPGSESGFLRFELGQVRKLRVTPLSVEVVP